MGRDVPVVADRIGHAAGAVAIKLILRFHHRSSPAFSAF